MSNNTARLAREWAEDFLTHADKTDDRYDPSKAGVIAAAERILATTDPLTMADVEWDDDKHYLTGATGPFGDEVVMMWYDDDTDHIFTNGEEWPRDRLTPNGKKYELREVGAPEEPEHPATLVTEQDYVNAPHGTIVAEPGGHALTKGSDGGWWPGGTWRTSREMSGTKRDVLRRGWGK